MESQKNRYNWWFRFSWLSSCIILGTFLVIGPNKIEQNFDNLTCSIVHEFAKHWVTYNSINKVVHTLFDIVWPHIKQRTKN